MIFSDESKINYVDNTTFTVKCRADERLDSRNIAPQLKYGGGSVSFWACFSAKGLGDLVFIDTRMDAEDYIEINR